MTRHLQAGTRFPRLLRVFARVVRAVMSAGVVTLLVASAGCTTQPDPPQETSRRPVRPGREADSPLGRVAVSTPGNWTDLTQLPRVAPPREVTDANVPATRPSEAEASSAVVSDPIVVRVRLTLYDQRGKLLGDHFLPPQSMKVGDVRTLDAGEGPAETSVAVQLHLLSVAENSALLRVAIRKGHPPTRPQEWLVRLDAMSGQSIQSAGRGHRFRLDIRADGIPLPPPVEPPPLPSVLEQLRRQPPPEPEPSSTTPASPRRS